MNAKSLCNIFPLIFLLILPAFGKSIDYQESIFFLSFPLIIFFAFVSNKKTCLFGKKYIYIQYILILLYLSSTLFSQNIGISYYSLFYFINVLFMVNTLILIGTKPENIFNGIITFSLIFSSIFLLNKFKILPLTPKTDQDNFILQIWGHSYLSDFIVLSIPILIQKLHKHKKTFLLALIVIITTLILTNSRSSLVALIIGLIFFLKSRQNKLVKILFVVSLFSLAIIFFSTLLAQSTSPKSPSGSRLQYWQEAAKGFIKSPLIGNGPSTFTETNRIFRTDPRETTGYVHNSILSFLCENGILFTLIFFSLILIRLLFQFRQNRLIFIICLISFTNSLLDPSWNNYGILAITLLLLFVPPVVSFSDPPVSQKKFLYPQALILLLFFFSKTTSDILFLTNHHHTGILIDPFNLNSRLALINNTPSNSPQWQLNADFLKKYFKNDLKTFQTLTDKQPLPESESYYWHLIDLDPLNSHSYFQALFNYYQNTNNISKINNLQNKLLDIFPLPSKSTKDNLETSKIFYMIGYYYYHNNQIEKTIVFLEKANIFSPLWGFFHLELANAYWLNNQPDKAIYQLSIECQKHSSPTKECRNYLNEFPQKPTIRSLETYNFPPQ